MSIGKRLLMAIIGYLLIVYAGNLAITQGNQYFWSQQHPRATPIGSAELTAVGIAFMVVGIILLFNAFRPANSSNN